MPMTLFHTQPDVKVSQAPWVIRGERMGHIDGGSCRREQNHISRPAGRRRSRGIGFRYLQLSFYALVYAILILSIRGAAADETVQPDQYGRRARDLGVAQEEEILLDHSPQPMIPGANIEKRQDLFNSLKATSGGSEKQTSSSTRRLIFDATATAIPSPSSSSLSSSTASAPTPESTITTLPKPFDGGFGTNYTQSSCPTFLKAFSTNTTFISCLPFSLLLQNSVSFFDVSRDSRRVVQTLDASCIVNFPMCKNLMSNFAQELKKDSNCGQDFRRENPLVGQAYNGLVAYETSYWAGCQKDTNGSYCFATAIGTQTTSNSDSFTYYLPLGIALPAPAKPSCSQCLRNTMSIFYQASANKTLPVNQVYVDAARMIDLTCGPTFANTTTSNLAASGNSASPSRTGSMFGAWMTLGVFLVHYLWIL